MHLKTFKKNKLHLEIMDLLSKEKRGFLFGNEAIVRGALESGVGFVTSYPGTPASEIGDTFAKIAEEQGIYFEYSVNEKAALEAAAGAAFSGIKSIVSFKHYGLNVASDSLLPLAYLECPFVIVTADDPACWSSVQTEQDSRWYSRLGKIPTLEPANSQEAKEMTKLAFQLSQKYKIPIMIRLTTRVCYSKSVVKFGKIIKGKIKGSFKKGYKLGSCETVTRHKKLLEKLNSIKREVENSKFNFVEKGKEKIGIITCSAAYNYVKEALQELNIKLPLLKIGFSYPFPENKVRNFIKNLKGIIVVEELDPVLEEEVRKIANTNIKVWGKEFFQEAGELKPENVFQLLGKILKKPIKFSGIKPEIERKPLFCAGCPHRSTFYAIKKTLGKNKIFGGDIGCYMLGALQPYEMNDYVVSMGASIGVAHGISKTTTEKPIIFIGDSTFFHAGIPQLINLVYNKANALVIVLDNRFTAMTGHQPHPGTGWTGMHEITKALAIEEIAKACQADFVKTSNVWNFNQLCKDVQEAYDAKGVSVLVAKGECRLFTIRQLARQGKEWPRFEIIKQKPELEQLSEFRCPAIYKNNEGKWQIDKNLCWGCTICKQLFPDCIEIAK